MGLLLSVLVVCVGVLEVIACVRHFQDGYLPLWTPHCAVTSGFAITHDRWRKLPSFDYAKNDDEKHFEDLTGAKNGTVTLGLQDGSVEKFGKTLHRDASLQDDHKVVSEVNLQESEVTFVAQKLSDSVAEPEDNIVNFTSDIRKQTVTDVFQSDIYNNNLVQTEHNLEADITFHTQDSNLTSEQDIQTKCEAPDKKAELIQGIPLKHVEEHEDNDIHETTVVGALHHEETTLESDSRLEPQTSSSDAEVIPSADIDTQPQDEVKSEETPEELIETLKKTPSPVRISPPISTPPLTPKKSKADISWPTFFPGAPVIKRPSVSFATPEALLAGEDPEPRLKNDEDERPATPPPIIKRSKENTPVPSDVESRSISSESLGEDVDQEEEDNEEQSLFSGIRDKSPTSIISGNDFSKKELELQRRKSYKLKRFNSAVETVSRDEQTEDRSFSEDKKGASHAVKSREPKRRLKNPVKATSFEDSMLRDIRDGHVVEGGTTLKLGKEVKFVDEPAVVAEEEEILLEQEAQTPQEESEFKTDEGLKVSFGQVESEPEKYVVHDEKSQVEKNYFTEQKESVISDQKIFDESENIQAAPDERFMEELNQEQCSSVTKPVDENQDVAGVINQLKHDKVPHKATKTESDGQSNEEDEIQQHVITEKSMEMQNTPQVHSKPVEVKSSEELTTKIDSKHSEERKDDLPSPKQVETLKDNSEMHSKSTQLKSIDQSTTIFDSKQSEEKLGDKQLSKEEEEEEEEEIVEWIEEEIILDDSEVPSRAMEINRSNEISTKLDTRQNEEKRHTKQVVAEEKEEEQVEEEEEEIEEEEEEEEMIVNNSKVHSKAVEIKSSGEMSTKTYTKQDEEEGKGNHRVTEEVEEEEEEEEAEEEELVEEEEQELEQEPAVVLDKSKVHSKAIEIKSSDEMSIKTDSKQDDRKGETKSADAEQEEDVDMVDNSEVHSKAVEIKASVEVSNKTKQDGEEVVIDTSKVHSKPAETKSSDETTTKVLAKEGEEEDEGLGIEEKASAAKVSDEQAKGLTTMKVSDEGQQERQSGVRFAEPERSTRAVEGEEEEDSSSYTLSESTQQKTPPKEAFWLIFSGEYTKAMSKDWHSGHFCCWQCDESLTGQRYVLRDDHPYCIKCYESVFANTCEECSKIIGIDSKDLSYKDKHWHEACFLCNKCRVSLVDKQFGSKADKIYCGNCYDSQFASRCDGCGEIFRAGTKKMEYKTRQWHEKCFCCCVCKTPIGTKSFIPREQEIYCATCYEEKFATRCVKCNKIITSGGVTYKNEPWHRECFTCTHCNTSLAGQRFTSRDEKPYCADCFGELFAKRCTSCSRPITGIGGTRFISFEDRHWHNDCFICASCKTSLVGRGFITDGDDIICPECAKQKLM